MSKEFLKLWYREPASEWLEALPVGNGRLGAMVFGGVQHEVLQLNEATLWQGEVHDYCHPNASEALPEIRRFIFDGQYKEAEDLINREFMSLPLSQMHYQFPGNLHIDTGIVEYQNYYRELDLNDAIVRTEFQYNAAVYSQEVFSSHPDQVIVARFACDKPSSLSLNISYDSLLDAQIDTDDNGTIIMTGNGHGMGPNPGQIRFAVATRVIAEGGTVRVENGIASVQNADAVILLISMATNYLNFRDLSGDPIENAIGHLNKASVKSYHALKEAHIADYQRLFNRVNLNLGITDAASNPTNERIANFLTGNDPQLAELHFQYGRYLLISCSRPGGQPATLQGLWNNQLYPAWGSKYTVNINTEMNYWPAAPTNLLECMDPLFDMIEDLTITGANVAKVHYGAGGWMCHHNTDIWRGAAPIDGPRWGMWPTGGAWLCKTFWDYYLYTGDIKKLEKHYPIMKGAAQFFLDSLAEEPSHGWLVTCPSVSPENDHPNGSSICAGPTMDNQIIRDLFNACVRASEILNTDLDFRDAVKAAEAKLPPMQIGKAGQLQEWLEDWDVEAPEQDHRHVSHLYGLYPSDQIDVYATPDLAKAAYKTLEMRGAVVVDDNNMYLSTGWSLAWKINLWARLGDSHNGYYLLANLLTPERTAPNLFDLHPPFQIDGNFGAVSGIAEMLMSSYRREIRLLPALPKVWPKGSVSGLLAYGGFELDLAWEEGALTAVTVKSKLGGRCTLRYGEKVVSFDTEPGKSYRLNDRLTAA